MQAAPSRQPHQPPRASSKMPEQASAYTALASFNERLRDSEGAASTGRNMPSEKSNGESLSGSAIDLQTELEQLQAVNEPLDITMGVEIECLLAVNHWGLPSQGDISPRSGSGMDMVREVLAQELTARCATCGRIHKFNLQLAGVREWAGVRDHMINYEGLSYGAWTIVGDSTVQPTKEWAQVQDLYHVDIHPLEIRSRILSLHKPSPTRIIARDLNHTHSITYQEEVTAVLSALDKAFNQWDELDQDTPMPSYIYSNETCGLHVHIGNGHKGFPFRTVKNVVSTYVANEMQIDAMHSTKRIGGAKHPLMIQHNRFAYQYWDTTVITPQAYNMPWATHHHMSVYKRRGRLARDSPMLTHDFQESHYPAAYLDDPEIRRAAFEYSCAAQLTLINRAPNLEALRHMQDNWSHNSTVNLENLPTKGELSEGMKRKMTIEFRQHAGTLSVTEVLAWIDVVSSVVEFSHKVSDKDIAVLCTEKSASPFHTTDSFLSAIAAAPKTVKHYREKSGFRGNIPCPSYAQQRFDRMTQRPMMSFHAHEPIAALIRFLAERYLRLNDPEEVQYRITKKFALGGYGQFPDSFLNLIPFDLTDFPNARQQLRIGWTNSQTEEPARAVPSPPACAPPRRVYRITNGEPSSTSSSSDDEKLQQDTGNTKISDTSADVQMIKLAEGEIGATFVPRDRHEGTAFVNTAAADPAAVHPDRLALIREEERADGADDKRDLRAVLADHDIHVPEGGQVQPFRGWRMLSAGGSRGFSKTHALVNAPAPLALGSRALRKSATRLVTPVIVREAQQGL